MRRRIWWQICILDVRTAENHGSDQDVAQQQFDTKFPLNINDDDLIPGSVEQATPRVGITEMSLSLIRYEIINVLWHLRSNPKFPDNLHGLEHVPSTVQQIDGVTEACKRRLESRYLRYCDMNTPFHWFISTVARMMIAKMWINVHHRFKLDSGAELTQKCKDRLFPISIEIVEFCLLLERERSTTQWKWAFRNYVPWQALTFILSQICEETRVEMLDRAWVVVQNAFEEWADVAANRGQDLLWLRMKQLLAKAQRTRESRSVGAFDAQGYEQREHWDSVDVVPHTVQETFNLDEKDTERNLATATGINNVAVGTGIDLSMAEQENHEWSRTDENLLSYFDDDSFNNIDWATGMDPWLGWNGAGESTGRTFDKEDNLW